MRLQQKLELLKRHRDKKIYIDVIGEHVIAIPGIAGRQDIKKKLFFLPILKPIKAKEKCLPRIKVFEQLKAPNMNRRHYILSVVLDLHRKIKIH